MIDDVDQRLTVATVRCGARSAPRSAGSGRQTKRHQNPGAVIDRFIVGYHTTSFLEVGQLPAAATLSTPAHNWSADLV